MSQAVRQLPDRFGDIQDFDEHIEKSNALREQLEVLYFELRDAVCGADLAFDTDGLTLAERASGLVRARFRRWPAVLYAGDWPSSLVAAQEIADLAAAEAKPKARRRRLAA